jgi:hypothetical protein
VGSEVQVFPGPPFLLWQDGGLRERLILAALPLRLKLAGVAMVGAVAQLGEHLLCKQGVSGSIPLSSTKVLVLMRVENILVFEEK